MYIRWREETSVITSKFERTVTELHSRLDEEKKRNQQITEKYNRNKITNEKVQVMTTPPICTVHVHVCYYE